MQHHIKCFKELIEGCFSKNFQNIGFCETCVSYVDYVWLSTYSIVLMEKINRLCF